MPFSVDDTPFGSLSVTLADVDGTLSATIMATAPATLSLAVYGAPPGVPSNGTEGQILVKASDAAWDTEWVDNYATELRVIARNETGSTLAKGTVVYINGAAGNKPTLAKAIATGDATSAQTVGLVSDDIPNNKNGEVTVRGLLSGLNTSAYMAGTQLYLSGTTAGGWTSTKPVAPIHLVYVGIVSRQHVNQGQIEVAIQNGYELDELHDVLIVSPTNGQVLKYDSATGLWKNQTDLNSGVWGQISGTLSNQTDLQAALDGKYSTSNPAGYITSSALTPYLLSSTAASTYYPLTNPAGYITSSALAGYATESWVTSQGYLTTADLSGYAELTGAAFTGTVSVTSGTNQTTVDATALTLSDGSDTLTLSAFGGSTITFSDSTVQSTAYVAGDVLQVANNLSDLDDAATARGNLGLGTMATETASDYLTTAAAASTYYPLTGNPSGFLTSASLAGYATESFVTSQGYITSAALAGYATESWVASQGYLTTAPVTSVAGKTGAVTLTASDISGLGTMATASASDYSTTTVANGLYYPLSSNPAGYLTSAPVTSVAGKTGAVTLANTDISGLGTLSTVNDAPSDGNQYARKNGAWDIVSVPPSYITSVSSPLSVTSGTLSIDLSAYATQSWVTSQLGSYLTTASASSTYLTQTSAASDYLSKAGNLSGLASASTARTNLGLGTMATETASNYLTTSAAASTYLTQSNAASTYQTISGMSSYLTTSAAASTYYLQTNPSGYLNTTAIGNGSLAAGDAILDGLQNATSPSTSNPFATEGYADSVVSSLAANIAASYAPLASPTFTGDPKAPTPATSDNDTSIATTAFVKAQGYVTAATAPVTSVAGKTGAVTLAVADVSGAAPLASPALTGTPTAPTAGAGTSTTQIATTAFVTTADNLKANLASPSFTGTPTAPTAAAGTNTTQIATTAFVQQEVPDFASSSDITSPSTTNKVVSPNDVVQMLISRATFDTQNSSPTFSTSGTGAEAYKVSNDRMISVGTPNASITGYGQFIYESLQSSWGILGAKRGASYENQNWNKKLWASGTCCFTSIGDSNTTTRVMVGGRASVTTGDPTKSSVGWKLVGGGTNALVLVTYGWNGSTSVVTETTSSFTPVVNETFDWMIYHEPNASTPASSKAYLYVNDSLVATGIYAPSDANAAYNFLVQSCEANGSHATRMGMRSFPIKIWWSR